MDSYCILGKVQPATTLARLLRAVLSGQHQHERGSPGPAFDGGQFVQVTAGSDIWIGAVPL